MSDVAPNVAHSQLTQIVTLPCIHYFEVSCIGRSNVIKNNI